jgi:hypothetical protein
MAIFRKNSGKSSAFQDAGDAAAPVTSDDLDTWQELFLAGELDAVSREDLAYLLNRLAVTVKVGNDTVRAARNKLSDLQREVAATPRAGRTGSPTEAFDFMTEAQKEAALKKYAAREIATIENARTGAADLRKRYTKAMMEAQVRLSNVCSNYELPEDAAVEISAIKDNLRISQDNVFSQDDDVKTTEGPASVEEAPVSAANSWVTPTTAYGSGTDSIDDLFE